MSTATDKYGLTKTTCCNFAVSTANHDTAVGHVLSWTAFIRQQQPLSHSHTVTSHIIPINIGFKYRSVGVSWREPKNARMAGALVQCFF